MSILQINKFLYRKGGSESYMFGLAEGLRRRGLNIQFWGMTDERNIVIDKDGFFPTKIDYRQCYITKKIGTAINSIYSTQNRKKISSYLSQHNIKIAHIHNFNFQITPSILPELKKKSVKIIYTAHDSQLACPYHRLYNFQKGSTCLKCIDGSYYHCCLDRCFDGSLLRSSVAALESYLFHYLNFYNKFIDLIISPSQFLADIIAHRYSGRIEVLPNFVSLPTTTTSDKDESLVYVGRVSREKGILELVNRFEEAKVSLTVIGDGPDLSVLRNYKHVSVLGPLYGAELFNRIRGAKFVIQPSRGFENCPMTVIEAFACGTPVIAPEHSGFKELIKPGYTGFFVDFKAADLIDRIIEILDNYSPILSKCCLKEYSEKYSEERHIDRIVKYYEELLDDESV